jgi:UDP-GlcNAc3NAcA epimerase
MRGYQIMRTLMVVGNRPNFIKCSPLVDVLKDHGHGIKIIHTGQHYDNNMSDIFFKELEIPDPDYNLGIGSAPHGEQTGRMIIQLERVLLDEKPDLIFLFGDTNSTLAGAIAGSKLNMDIGHVEAGCRSFDRTMPEEVNRIIVDHVSDFLYAPTDTAHENLIREGIGSRSYRTGDIMVDVMRKIYPIAVKTSTFFKTNPMLYPCEYILATIHRQSNTDNVETLRNILQTFELSQEVIVFPMHPRTKKVIADNGITIPHNIRCIEPLGYSDMLVAIASAKKVVTDSGGVQKEAYILKTPCVTVRDTTEWVETLDGGSNVLVGDNMEKLLHNMTNESIYSVSKKNYFGVGNTAEIIVKLMERFESDRENFPTT